MLGIIVFSLGLIGVGALFLARPDMLALLRNEDGHTRRDDPERGAETEARAILVGSAIVVAGLVLLILSF